MTGRYKAYPEYKDSGIKWLGSVPKDWPVYSLKRTVDKVTNGIWGSEPDEENDLIVLRVADFNRNQLNISDDNLTFRSIEPKDRPSRLLQKGDLLIEKSGGGDKTLVGCVVLFDKDYAAVTSNFVAKMTPQKGFDSSFLRYAFSMLYAGKVNFPSVKQTTGIQNLDSDAYLLEKFTFPPYQEQQKIANFLDHEAAKIDTLIAKQEKLIELLKEKRRVVISHAVTKGLNPQTAMKDSGVKWLGDVPVHWELKKFKHLFKIRKRIAGKTGYDILSITQKGIKIKDITTGEGQLSMDYSKYQLVYKGDFAMNHMDLLTGFVDISNHDGVTSPDYRVFTLEHRTSSAEYYLLLLQMGYLDKLFYPLGQGAAHIGRWRLPTEAFNEFLAPCPPLEEQEGISKFVKETHKKIDALIEKAEDAIILMKERKSVLISAVVTGKIDVRDWSQS